MTVKKLIETYEARVKYGYETMDISEVIIDLRKCLKVPSEKEVHKAIQKNER